MSNRGWIKLHRKIQDHWIYQEKRQFSRYEAWLDLIMLANHENNKTLIDGELVTVKKGSFITSKRQLCERWNWSNTKVDNFLKLLEQDGMATHKSDTKKTVVTIAKYEVYHKRDEEKRHENETKTKQKHNRNETETDKQELKELKNLEEEERASDNIENPFKLFEQNICMLSPINQEALIQWCGDLGDELVVAAIKLAAKYNARSFAYVEDIFIEWHKNGISTVEQARSYVQGKSKKDNTIPFKPKQEESDIDALLDKFREV